MKFEDVLKSENYLILDTETTGLGRDAEVCQIAIINAAGETLLNTYVKPYRPIPDEAIRIHGITNDKVADAPIWPELAAKVAGLLSGQHLIIYNAGYDLRVLEQSAAAWGRIFKRDFHSYCAMLGFALVYGEFNEYYGNYTLQSLAKAAAYYGVETTGAHDALADCLTTLAVCKGMMNSYR